jgi:hypothetical protein
LLILDKRISQLVTAFVETEQPISDDLCSLKALDADPDPHYSKQLYPDLHLSQNSKAQNRAEKVL